MTRNFTLLHMIVRGSLRLENTAWLAWNLVFGLHNMLTCNMSARSKESVNAYGTDVHAWPATLCHPWISQLWVTSWRNILPVYFAGMHLSVGFNECVGAYSRDAYAWPATLRHDCMSQRRVAITDTMRWDIQWRHCADSDCLKLTRISRR